MKKALELILRERGPAERPELLLEVSSAYLREFYKELKQTLPYGLWHYEPDLQTWFVHPGETERVGQIALRHFDVVWMVRGIERTNVRSGEKIEEPTLFA